MVRAAYGGSRAEDPQPLAVARPVEAALLRAEGATREALALADLAFADDRNAITTLHSKLAAEEVLNARWSRRAGEGRGASDGSRTACGPRS